MTYRHYARLALQAIVAAAEAQGLHPFSVSCDEAAILFTLASYEHPESDIVQQGLQHGQRFLFDIENLWPAHLHTMRREMYGSVQS